MKTQPGSDAEKELHSWVDVADDSGFSLYNLPYGVYRSSVYPTPRICSAIGSYVIDLDWLQVNGFFNDCGLPPAIFQRRYLNDFIALGKPVTSAVRRRLLQLLLADGDGAAREQAVHFLLPLDQVKLLLPLQIGDYTDFYSSREHAYNVGCMFRDPQNALPVNWLHLPVGYHGRASSIVVSGTPLHRPCGQRMPEGASQPVYGPSQRLDFELEMAFVIGKDTSLGARVCTADAEDYIFGLMLFNDWSARDIQQWEYVPLGPFLGKNFGSTLSPWVIPLEALEPFRVDGPVQDPPVLPYLSFEGRRSFDIHLEVWLQPEGGEATRISRSNYAYMYWNMCQQLAHHTVNGCNIRVGDLMASGTISGPEAGSYGSLLELAWKGTRPIVLADGSERKFLLDGDTLILRGTAQKGKIRVGFGEAAGKILPAIE